MRAEVGADARIVAANRVRKGGVGGFFAQAGVRSGRRAPDGDRRVRRHEPGCNVHRHRPRHPCAARIDGASPRRDRVPTAPRRAAIARAEGRAPATILELADAVSDDERNDVIDLVEERSVSTEAPQLRRGARPLQPRRSTRRPRSWRVPQPDVTTPTYRAESRHRPAATTTPEPTAEPVDSRTRPRSRRSERADRTPRQPADELDSTRTPRRAATAPEPFRGHAAQAATEPAARRS